jgi:hypothetical protein
MRRDEEREIRRDVGRGRELAGKKRESTKSPVTAEDHVKPFIY